MALWGNDDSELGKPSWLTEEQKRNCFRTRRGWEIPLSGVAVSGDAVSANGATVGAANQSALLTYRSPSVVGPTELLVCLPIDSASSTHAAGYWTEELRGLTSLYGVTHGGDLPNYTPYITNPATGSVISLSVGTTAYIPVIGADVNVTDLPKYLNFSITGPTTAGFTYVLISATGFTSGSFPNTNWINQPTQLVGSAATGFYDQASKSSIAYNPYGGWGGITNGAAVLRITTTSGGPTGTFNFTLFVSDGRTASTGNGKTGNAAFSVVVS